MALTLSLVNSDIFSKLPGVTRATTYSSRTTNAFAVRPPSFTRRRRDKSVRLTHLPIDDRTSLGNDSRNPKLCNE